MQGSTSRPESGFVSLIASILGDVRALMRQEVQLLKDEVAYEVSKAGRAVSRFGVGVALVTVAVFFFLLMLVHGLHDWIGLPLWASYGVVGGLLAGCGVALLWRAKSLAENVHATPQRAIHAMKENAQWIKERMTLNRT